MFRNIKWSHFIWNSIKYLIKTDILVVDPSTVAKFATVQMEINELQLQ